MAKVIKTAIIAAATIALVVLSAGTLAPTLFASAITAAGGLAALAGQYALITGLGTLIAGGIGMLTSRGVEATAQNFGTKVTGTGAQVPRQIVYGETRIAGTIVKMRTSGNKNNTLNLGIVLAGHEIESLEGVYIDTDLITTSTSTISGETVYTATNSNLTNTENDNAFTGGRLLRYTFHDGSQTTSDGYAGSITGLGYGTNAKFQGMAYVFMRLVYDPEKLASIPKIWFKVKGKKVYDPRTSTTAWSDNPALIARDFLVDTTYGLKSTASEINDTNTVGGFYKAADICDQQVVLANGSSYENRYTANGFTNASATLDGILEGILTACSGSISYTNGKFNLFVGGDQSASLTIRDDDILQPISLSTKSGGGDLYNAVKALYVSPANNYQGVEAPILSSNAYLGADTPTGESNANYKKTLEIQLPFTTSSTQAQRLQKIALVRQRQTTTMTVLATLEFMALQPNDWVYLVNERLSFGEDYNGTGNPKTFEVKTMQMEFFEVDGSLFAGTRLTLQEIDDTVYDYAAGDYQPEEADSDQPSTGDRSIAIPTIVGDNGLVQRTRVEGPTAKIDIIATWTNDLDEAVQGTELQFKESTDTDYSVVGVSGKASNNAVIPNVSVGKIYDVRIRHFSWDNVYSAFVSYSQITILQPNTISAPTSAAATTDKPFFIELTWTNPANTNLRAVEVHYSATSGFTPDTGTLLNTYYGDVAKSKKVILGISAGLSYDTNYYFKLRSINVYGSASGYTAQVTGQFKKAQNADVENLNASAITAGTIDAGTITVENLNASNFSTGTLSVDRLDGTVILEDDLTDDTTTISGGNILTGNITLSTTSGSGLGSLKAGKTSYEDTSTAGYYLGFVGTGTDAGDAAFSIGNATSGLTYKPTAGLTVTGNLSATTGAIGGFTIATDYIADAADSMGLASTVTAGDDVRFWAGETFANRATAPFRVTESGVFTATSAAITGAITATSGSIANSVTVGGTAASTVASDAAAGNQAADQISLLPRADDSEWTVGTGGKGIWNVNGETSENAVVVENGPHGELERIWKATSTDGSGADGGFQNTSTANKFPIASDTTYRFSVFIKQDNTNGTIYLGAYNFSNTDATLNLYAYDGSGADANKYWFATDLPTQGEWYLLVGFINPSNTSSNSGKGGIYNLSTGVKVTAFDDFRFSGDGSETDATTFSVRTYNYYGVATPTSIVRWAHPRVDRLDRRAPSIAELLRGWTSLAEPINAGVTITGGGITMDSGGAIKGGQSAYNTGTGFFLGYDTNAYKFSIGNAGNNSLAFDGTNLAITGAITATSLTLSGITIPKTDLATGVQTSLGSADSAIQDADTSVNLGLNAGSVGGITINSASLTSGSHTTYGSTAQGFFLGSNGSMSFADGTNQTLTIDTSGNLAVTGTVNASAGEFTGSVSIGSTGAIYGGTMDEFLKANTSGFFLGYDTDAYKLSVGNSSGEVLTWDGSKLNVEANTVSFATGGEQDYSSESRYTTSQKSATVVLANDSSYFLFDNRRQDLAFPDFIVSYYLGPLTSGTQSSQANARNGIMDSIQVELFYADASTGSPSTWTSFRSITADSWYTDTGTNYVFSNFRVKDSGSHVASLDTRNGILDDYPTMSPFGDALDGTSVPVGLVDNDYFINIPISRNTVVFPKGRYFIKVVITVTDGSLSPYPSTGSPTATERRVSIPNASSFVHPDFGQAVFVGGAHTTIFTDNNRDNETLIKGGSVYLMSKEGANADDYDSTAIFFGGRGTTGGTPNSAYGPLHGLYFFNDRDAIGSGSGILGSIGSPQFSMYVPYDGSKLTFGGDANFTDGLYINGVAVNAGAVTGPAGSDTQIQYNDGGSLGASANLTFNDSTNTLTVQNLTVSGTTTTVNTDNLTVKDPNITLNYATGDSSSTANNAGITIQDAVNSTTDASILWKTASDTFEFSHGANIPKTYLKATDQDVESGTWTSSTTSDSWGSIKLAAGYSYTYNAGAYKQYNIPAGADTCYMSFLKWSDGGYVDVHAIQADGDLVFLGRISTGQSVENSNEGNATEHDGQAIVKIATGLDNFSSIRITNKRGSFYFSGLAFSTQQLDSFDSGMIAAETIHSGVLSNVTNTNWDAAYTYSQVGHLPLAGGTLTGAVSWPSGSSTNANTAYTYSQVGHLPLAGGTLTGNLTVNPSGTTAAITVGDSSQTSYSNLVLYAANGTGTQTAQLFKGSDTYTSWGGVDAFNIYTSKGTINFHPAGQANRFAIESSRVYTKNSYLLVGNNDTNNSYDTVATGNLYFGGLNTSTPEMYSIGVGVKENVGGDYTKLDIQWHTGVRIGASRTYGGTRFYDDSMSNSGVKIFSVGEGDVNVRVYNDLNVAGQTNLANKLDVKKIGADSIVDIRGNSNFDPILNLRSDQGAITTEGFQIWYDNSEGDVHLHTTFPNDAAAIRFHTATGTDKATNNERFTINGNGLINIVSGNLAMGGTTVISSSRQLRSINAIYNNSDTQIMDLSHSTYTILKDPEGSVRMYLGDTGDAGNYYDNTAHNFRNRASAAQVQISDGGVNLQNTSATYKVQGTTVIDSNRQIFAKTGTQVGEDGTYGGYGVIGFGGITNGYNRVFGNDGTDDGLFLAAATGRGIYIRPNGGSADSFGFSPSGQFLVAGVSVLDQSRNFTGVTITAGVNRPVKLQNGLITMKGETGGWAFGLHALGSASTDHGGFGFLGTTDAFNYYYIGESYNAAGNFMFYKSGQLDIGGTTILDSSKNLSNIGTINGTNLDQPSLQLVGSAYATLNGAKSQFGKGAGTGSNSWDTHVYSTTGYKSGVKMEYSPATLVEHMAGISTNPSASASYTNINYAWYVASGTLYIYESGTSRGTFGTVAIGDKLSIIYDNTNVYYYHNNVLKRTVAVGANVTFHFDTSLLIINTAQYNYYAIFEPFTARYEYPSLKISSTSGSPFEVLSSSAILAGIKIGSATQTSYSSLILTAEGGNTEIFKGSSTYTNWGGANSFNIYNSNGLIAFHPSGNSSVFRVLPEGIDTAANKTFVINGAVSPQTLNTGTQSLVIKNSGSSTSGGLVLRSANDTHLMQLYGDSSGNFGFLESAWGNWDIRKSRTGSLYLNNSTTWYLNTTSNSAFAGALYGGLSIGEAPVNYGSWNRQLNLNGDGNARMHVKTTAGIQMGMYAHDTWHNSGGGYLGTYTNNNVTFVINAVSAGYIDTSRRFTWQGQMLIGGEWTNNSYSAVSSTSLAFGGGNDLNNYSIGTSMENYGGNYTKLNIKWHTGIRFFVLPQYGGVRFFTDAAMANEIFSIGETDSNVRAAATIFANRMSCGYDSGVANSIGCSGWFRSSGGTGWYNATYAGGIYMADTTWVSVYNNKSFYVANQIAATGNITAYYSDERLKTKTGNIENALDKVRSLSGFKYVENDLAKELGYTNEKQQVGLSAQQVQAVLPEAVSLAPVDMETDEFTGEITSKSGEDYLTVDYSRLVPLLVEAIKEQQEQIDELKLKLKEK